MIRMTKLAALILAVGVMMAAGCGKAEQAVTEKNVEKAIEDNAKAEGQDVDVDIKGDSMTIKSKDDEGNDVTVTQDGDNVVATTKDGKFQSFGNEGGALPEGFPDDIPFYTGAKVMTASAITEEELFTVQAIAPASVDAVVEYYKKELKAKGWEEANIMMQGAPNPMHMLNYTKEKRNVMVIVNNDDGNTSLVINTMKDE